MTGQQIDRDQLRDLAENATEGPWEVDYMGDLVSVPEREKDRYGGHIFIGTATGDASSATEDAEFIAASRQAVPALLEALGQAEQRIRDLTQEVRDERAACLDQIEQVQARDARIKAWKCPTCGCDQVE